MRPAVDIENHLVDTRRRDLEVSLHISPARRSPEHLRIGMDDGQGLALLFREPGLLRLAIIVGMIHQSIQNSMEAVMNIR